MRRSGLLDKGSELLVKHRSLVIGLVLVSLGGCGAARALRYHTQYQKAASTEPGTVACGSGQGQCASTEPRSGVSAR